MALCCLVNMRDVLDTQQHLQVSTAPNVDEREHEAAWRATVLPVWTTSSGMAVWEVSERYTAWLSSCHIKLGVAGGGPPSIF